MSDVSQGTGWWMASDGKWYAPEQHPDHQAVAAQPPQEPGVQEPALVNPTTPSAASAQMVQPLAGSQQAAATPSLSAPALTDAVVSKPKKKRTRWLVAAAVVVVLIAVVAFVLASKQNTSGLPSGVSLASFQQAIVKQAQASSPGWTTATSAACIVPSSWTPGKTFKCYVYDRSNTQLGVMNGTVIPTASGYQYNYNEDWQGNTGNTGGGTSNSQNSGSSNSQNSGSSNSQNSGSSNSQNSGSGNSGSGANTGSSGSAGNTGNS